MNSSDNAALQDNTSHDHAAAHRLDILNTAIEIFGRLGFSSASTNEIVKHAKVSKGLLFHHFKDKKSLYMACQLHVMEQYGEFMKDRVNTDSCDFFERILDNLHVKLEFGRKYPEYLTLINRAWYMDHEESILNRKAAEEYALKSAAAGQIYLNFYKGIDTSKFREKTDVQMLLNYVRLTMEAAWRRYSAERNNNPILLYNDIDIYINEAKEILDLFKNGAYI